MRGRGLVWTRVILVKRFIGSVDPESGIGNHGSGIVVKRFMRSDTRADTRAGTRIKTKKPAPPYAGTRAQKSPLTHFQGKGGRLVVRPWRSS